MGFGLEERLALRMFSRGYIYDGKFRFNKNGVPFERMHFREPDEAEGYAFEIKEGRVYVIVYGVSKLIMSKKIGSPLDITENDGISKQDIIYMGNENISIPLEELDSLEEKDHSFTNALMNAGLEKIEPNEDIISCR